MNYNYWNRQTYLYIEGNKRFSDDASHYHKKVRKKVLRTYANVPI
ncbi:hypothetical protein [Metallosphaera hakonensis]|nr:hypothetical protein [Metallosphaera hakonensis]